MKPKSHDRIGPAIQILEELLKGMNLLLEANANRQDMLTDTIRQEVDNLSDGPSGARLVFPIYLGEGFPANKFGMLGKFVDWDGRNYIYSPVTASSDNGTDEEDLEVDIPFTAYFLGDHAMELIGHYRPLIDDLIREEKLVVRLREFLDRALRACVKAIEKFDRRPDPGKLQSEFREKLRANDRAAFATSGLLPPGNVILKYSES